MLILTSRPDLQRRLAEWPDAAPDTSWALCFGSALPTPGELAAVREAVKVCDRAVLARLLPDRVLPPTYGKVAEDAGADVLWVPREVQGHVQVDVGVPEVPTASATLILQAITTVLPNLVVVERANLPLIRALRNIQHGLGDMFVLRVVG
ncbi:MAG: hypothetical protein WAZ18_00625 [Alphaproteobacteria bacterium]